METVSQRFDNRLATVAADLHQEMAGLRADLRTEMAGNCADLRRDMGDLGAGLRGEIAGTATEVRQEIAANAADVRREVAGLRTEMQLGFERIWKAMADVSVSLHRGIADARVETFRWSFLFWIGEVAVLGGLMAFMLRGIAPR
jgi:hypothetical protein